eukprot:jgi/Botrbrau1/7469/Bobra.0095s0007.1
MEVWNVLQGCGTCTDETHHGQLIQKVVASLQVDTHETYLGQLIQKVVASLQIDTRVKHPRHIRLLNLKYSQSALGPHLSLLMLSSAHCLPKEIPMEHIPHLTAHRFSISLQRHFISMLLKCSDLTLSLAFNLKLV